MGKTEIIDCKDLNLESYEKFLKSKLATFYDVKDRKVFVKDMKINLNDINNLSNMSEYLFDYQKFTVNLAIQKQRYAIFADCGTGKTAMFLEYIYKIRNIISDKKILIISPLAVIKQTIEEEKKFYNQSTITNLYKKDINEWLKSDNQIGIINYDKFHSPFDFKGKIGAVILDESSILKNGMGVTRNSLIESFRDVPFKLCCTATPAPNDREEYANHSTFLEYTRSNNEFFAKFFTNTEDGWIIKPHALTHFYKHLSEWSIYLRNPEKYNFVDNIKNLPKPLIIEKVIEWTKEQNRYLKKSLFSEHIDDLMSKKIFYSQLSKGFIKDKNNKFKYIETNKKQELLNILNENLDKKVIIWCQYNEEEKIIKNILETNNFKFNNINGTTPEEKRYDIVKDFQSGKFNILISKPRLLGFGMNLHFASVQIFHGLNDSYEQFYQAIRRSYRYGATEQLKVYIPITSTEKRVLNNVLRKKETFEIDSIRQEECFIKNLENDLRKFRGEKMEEKEILKETINKEESGENWKLYLADSIIKLRDMEKESIDFSIFSPPFASLFTYSEKIGDMGNSRDKNSDEFALHMEFFLKGLFNVMKTGKNTCCHVQQLSTYKTLDGFVGTNDFKGLIIKLFKKAGFIFFGEFVIKKNPQAQAIRNKVRSLSFAQLDRNRGGSRPGYNDYVLIFKKPGESLIPIDDNSGPSREEWINWATGVWTDIRETDVLVSKSAKSEEDVKHICPLQLEVIRRCIRLYTNEEDTVLDPFNGIGSSGVISLELNRKYIGIELKPEYFLESVRNFKKFKLMNTNYNGIRNALKKSLTKHRELGVF